MKAVNKVHDGLHLDFNPYDQPPNTMRDNRNGIITDLEDGSHMWTNLEGTLLIFTLQSTDVVMGTCWIRERLFMIVYNDSQDYVVIYEALYDETGDFTSLENRWEGENSILNLSIIHPIRSIFGYYENANIQRIYWTDNNNPPRVINVKDDSRVTIEEKFANFFPEMSPVYGGFEFDSILSGGNCKAGMYFFSWRLFKVGYYTDWSYLSSGVAVLPGVSGWFWNFYQDFQGGAPDEDALKKIRIKLTNLDTDYDSIQVCSFYSNAYNSAQPGVIFYDGDISGTEMTLDLVGNENLGTVTIDELMETSIVISKCKDMAHIKKMNVLANIEERPEIDVSGAHSENKNNEMEVSIYPDVHPVLLDTRGYPDEVYNAQNKPLCGIQVAFWETALFDLIPEIWYIAITETTFTDGSVRVIPVGNVFKLESRIVATAITSGFCRMCIVIKKYLPVGASSSDINNYVLDIYQFEEDYYNYKSAQFVNLLKGLPRDETVRYGVTFFDKTGRPFYTRHLYNLVTISGGTTVGPGDFKTGKANATTDPEIWNTHKGYDLVEGYSYQFTLGRSIGVTINGLDISGIKDQIGGFSIVRADIIRQNIAYGVLQFLWENSNDVKPYPSFRTYGGDTNVYEKGYSFYCPEDLFELDGFSIQPGDKIKNSYYMNAAVGTQAEYTGYEGMGRRESATDHCLYQKYQYLSTVDGTGNGAKDVEHEVSFYTRYYLGDASDVDGIVIDPSDASKLFFDQTPAFSTERSGATNRGIIIFDELEGEGVDVKGKYALAVTNPQILICSVRRENSSPYGGLGDSSLANTLYISTGHYQEINDAVLLDIVNGNNYVFNGINVYGGDSYVGLFDFQHLLKNDDLGGGRFNQSFITPIESRINLDHREGDHIARNRSWSATNTVGMNRDSTEGHIWEEFNYNDGYSSVNINDYYLALPYNFKLESQFDARMRYSPEKTYGELEDSFRKYNPLDLLDISTEFGSITNVRAKFNKILYWQRDAVGYIPINERALSANSFGDPVQLGVGGIFERYDELVTMIGNSNQFGLIESPAGFHWYDAVRKLFVSLTPSLKFNQDSIVKGLDSFFTNDIPNNMDQYDFDGANPNFGIVGGYDIRNKLVFVTFRMPGEVYETIGYNIKKNKFIGFFDFKARKYFTWKDYLYSIDDGSNQIFQHGLGVPGNYHGETNQMYFSIIVKDDDHIAKIFDNFEYIGSENSFDWIKYNTSSQEIIETSALSPALKFRNKRWYGNFPKVERERLVDGYLKITFYKYGGTEVTFNEIKTTFRKML